MKSITLGFLLLLSVPSIMVECEMQEQHDHRKARNYMNNVKSTPSTVCVDGDTMLVRKTDGKHIPWDGYKIEIERPDL